MTPLPRDGESLLQRIIEGSISEAEIEEAKRRLAPFYEPPALSRDTIDAYRDWETRVRPLHRAVAECLSVVYGEGDKNPRIALRHAEAAYAVGPFLHSRNPENLTLALGYGLLKNDRFFDAVDPLREAAVAFRNKQPLQDGIHVSRFLVDALEGANELKEALATCEEALARATEAGLRASHADLLLKRGRILAAQGNEDDALRSFEEAVAESRTLTADEIRQESVPTLGAMLMSFGTMLRQFGHFEHAIRTFHEAAEAERTAGYSQGYAWGLSEIGYTYRAAGDEPRCMQYVAMAAEEARAAGDMRNAARWQRQVDAFHGHPSAAPALPIDDETEATSAADAYDYSTMAEQAVMEGRLDDALRAAQIALNWAELRNDHNLEITALSVIGTVHSNRDELDQAFALMQRAVQLADRFHHRDAQVRLRANLANCLLRKHEYQRAADVLLESVATSKALLDDTEGSEIRQSIMSEGMHLYEMYAHLLTQMGDYEFAVWITEQARARNLTGWIEAETRLETIGDSGALRELRATEVELEVRHQLKDLDSEEMERLFARRKVAREKLDDSLRATGSPTLPWQEPADRGAVERALEEIVDALTGVLCLFSVSEGICAALATRNENGLQYTGMFIACDREQRKVGPLATLIENTRIERLAVVPHADLALLPYWELLDRCPRVQSLTIAPSVGVLRLCHARRRAARGPTLLLTDPTGSLPSVAFETDLVRGARPDAAVITPSTLAEIEARAPECTLFHAATHGLFFPDRPYHSGLVASVEDDGPADRFTQFVDADLEPADTLVEGGARLLTVAQIMARLSLRECRVAVLSACQSGQPRLHGGGELTGLPGAMLVAGARSVIASLWPVEDAATALLMAAFYDEWDGGRGHESSPSRALQRARQRLRAMTRAEAIARLGDDSELPDGERPFDLPFYADAFSCFGAW
jgi:CHAT domain-containing protein/tetratricopeptide (TPR) repeat protein